MNNAKKYEVREYDGTRPCQSPEVMQYLQLKLRPNQQTTQKGKQK
jgi:hypothetical protein